MDNSSVCVAYKEDLMKSLNCSEHTAIALMKRTGRSFRVGKCLVIPTTVYRELLNGQYTSRPYETPEGNLRAAAAIEIR